jgi:hypothetical protein
MARWKTGNGAKFCPERSAARHCVAGVVKGKTYHFRRPFLVHFLGEQNMNKEKTFNF